MNSEPAVEYQASITNHTAKIFHKTESNSNMSSPFDESKPPMKFSPHKAKPMPSEPDDFDRFAKNQSPEPKSFNIATHDAPESYREMVE